MVTAPAKKADDTKPVTPAKPSAPARVQVRAKALKGKKVKVSLKKTAEAKGYEIVYSTNVNFTKKATKKISTKNLTKTIKKLKKKPKRTPLIRTLQLQKPKNRSRLQKSLLQRRKRMLALNQKVRKKVQKNPQIHPKTLPPNL